MAPTAGCVLDLVRGKGEDMRTPESLVYTPYRNISTWQENLSRTSFI